MKLRSQIRGAGGGGEKKQKGTLNIDFTLVSIFVWIVTWRDLTFNKERNEVVLGYKRNEYSLL